MSIVSQENQSMLYDIILDIIVENNFRLPDNINIQSFIDDRCRYFHSNRFDFGTKEEINKKIIGLCYNYVLSNVKSSPPQMQQQQQSPQDFQTMGIMNNRSNQDMFDMTLKAKTQDFENAMAIKKPKDIDFEDKNEEDQMPIQNLDEIMSQTLADRERELQNITEKYSNNQKQKALKWLNQENNEENITMNVEESTPKITIQEATDVNLNINKVSTGKRVTFKLESDNKKISTEKPVQQSIRPFVESSLNEIKKEKSQEKSISLSEKLEIKINLLEIKLDTIVSNQNKIIEMLNNKLSESSIVESHTEVTEFDAI